jgi:hypothetical protein
MGNKSDSGKNILILGSSIEDSKFLLEIISKNNSISNIENRKLFTKQIFSQIQNVTNEVINIYKIEVNENSKELELLFKKFEKEFKMKTLLKIWSEIFFKIFQKNEFFKPFQSFITKETLLRISKSNYIPTVEDVEFCLSCKMIENQSFMITHNNEIFEFNIVVNELKYDKSPDLVLYQLSMSDFDDEEAFQIQKKQFQKSNEKLNDTPFILIFTKPEEMKQKVIKSLNPKTPSFLGKSHE